MPRPIAQVVKYQRVRRFKKGGEGGRAARARPVRGGSVARARGAVKLRFRRLLDTPQARRYIWCLCFSTREKNAPRSEVLHEGTAVARNSKTTKKRAQQLKHDKFRDATMRGFDRLGNRMEGRGRTILYALAGLVALAVLFGLYRTWNGRQADRAGLALGNAIKTATAPVTTGTPAVSRGRLPPSASARRGRRGLRKVPPTRRPRTANSRATSPPPTSSWSMREKGRPTRGLTLRSTRCGARPLRAVAGREAAAVHQARPLQRAAQDKKPVSPPTLSTSASLRTGRRPDESAEILFRIVEEARKAKAKDGKPIPLSTTARESSTKLETLSPERYAQLPPEPSAGPGNSIQNMPF